MLEQTAHAPHRVVIAGGGVAGLEALIALHDLAGDRVAITLVAPNEEFTIRALSVQEPFARPDGATYRMRDICADHGAELRQDLVARVDRELRSIVLESGDVLPYDSLLVAVGARQAPAYAGAMTFRGLQDAEALHGLLQDIEAGHVTQIAFVVPPGTTWPLPLYELALMTAERADSLCLGATVTIVTPEDEPLELFGPTASRQIDELLAERGIVVRSGMEVTTVDHGVVLTGYGRVQVRAQRVVALPMLHGPAIPGLPGDEGGFLRVDEHGLVPGSDDLYGAGDGTTQPIKQGGIAAQMAVAAARAIAARAGADVLAPGPVSAVLRAEMFTGSGSRYLRRRVGSSDVQASKTSDESMWWPPAKVAAPYLTRYLADVDATRHVAQDKRATGTGILG